MNKYFRHFITITKHKFLVMRLCFKCGQYKRGLLHDNSKYGFTEFFSNARYFQGNRSPISAEKEDLGYSIAWLHHKGHNPHHWEWWIDNSNTKKIIVTKIPYDYVIEMICDWIAAGIVYSGSIPDFEKPYAAALNYYNNHKDSRIFNPETQNLIEYLLNIITTNGINNFCHYVSFADSSLRRRYAAGIKL